MSDAPERIWICTHLGEYGNYYPEAVEAEGDHGGTAAEYIRADHVDALLKAEREKALREAQDRIRKKGSLFSVSVIEALISKDATDGN